MAPSRGLTRLPVSISPPSHFASLSNPSPCVFAWCGHHSNSRLFSASPSIFSGHNRWSKIKHDKAKVDNAKTHTRSLFAKDLAHASKLFGPDPALNPRLADLITRAKREGFAKTSIEAAIARGQGRSTTGLALENVVVEGLLPGNVACLVACESDQRLRTLQEVRSCLKTAGGAASATGYLFRKIGKITFEAKKEIGMDEALDAALDAGATDVWEMDQEGDESDSGSDSTGKRIVVTADVADTKAVGERVSRDLGLEIASSEVVWQPNPETMVELTGDEAAGVLIDLIDNLKDKETSVQEVFMNVLQGKTSPETWKQLDDRLG